MNILVLCEAYPSEANLYAMGFVHSRLLEYADLGHRVTVLSFSAPTAYEFEGVQVRPASAVRDVAGYDVVISHAPNWRHHLRFLGRHPGIPVVLVVHGHEMLLKASYYPEPFPFDRRWTRPLERRADAVYDRLKLRALRRFLSRSERAGRVVKAIFVSDWMRREAIRCAALAPDWVAANSVVVPNPVNRVFTLRRYRRAEHPRADFVCIRPLDNPKYAVDVVARWARENPERRFHVFGRGRYFEFNPLPGNVEVFRQFVPQAQIPELLDGYRAAVMPTRLDAQGVTMCEMASYGIPVITSDLEVTREVLGAFPNVARVPNDGPALLEEIPAPLDDASPLRLTFSAAATVVREVAFVEEAVAESRRAGEAHARRMGAAGAGR